MLTDLPCNVAHANSCFVSTIERTIVQYPTYMKAYGLVHLAPLLLFKRKQLLSMKECPKTLLKALKGYLRSLLFITMYSLWGNYGMCNLGHSNPSMGKYTFMFVQALAGSALCIESASRRIEIA